MFLHNRIVLILYFFLLVLVRATEFMHLAEIFFHGLGGGGISQHQWLCVLLVAF